MTLIDSQIEKFHLLIQRGIDAWTEAGKLLCEMVAADAMVLHRISENNDHITMEILTAFIRIGRREIYPYLIIDPSPGAKKLAGLPYDEQEAFYKDGLKVAVPRRNNTPIVEHKRIQDLTWKDTDVVFDVDRVRTVKEQLQLLRERAPAPKESRNSYVIPEVLSPSRLPDVPKHSSIPTEALGLALESAHVALMKARDALLAIDIAHPMDNHISTALGAVGKIRFALNAGELH